MPVQLLLPRQRTEHHESAREWPTPGLHELLAERASRSPSRVFIVDGTLRLSYADVAARVERLAAGCAMLGVGPGDIVSWQLPSWWEGAALAIAIDRLGAVNNPILPIYREREVSFIVRQTRSRVLFVPGCFRGFDHRDLARAVRNQAADLEHVIVVRDDPWPGMKSFADLWQSALPPPPCVPRKPHDVSAIFYTSGTTADPKGVLHTDSTLGAFVRNGIAVSRAGPDDVGLLQFPLTHIGGVGAFLMQPLLTGSRVVYLDQWEPEKALCLIESEGVTSAGGPPAILQGILAAPGFRPERVRSVRIAGSGAADIPPELIREVRRRIGAFSYRAYGLTECPMLSSGRPEDPEDLCATTDGRPTPGCRVRIVGPRGVVPAGEEGEIEVFGPQMCVGYLDPSLNAEAFTDDGFLRTGDLGVLNEAGYLRVTGRKKDIIIRKGENLSAKAIEDVLYEHPSVADVAVIGVPDPESGERVCACLVMCEGAALTLSEVREFMEAKGIMRQKIPERLEILPALPRNATGKVMKHELRARFRS
jgi:cyclohexanecarboxylate-CoA ligase